jgi:hypothetical protein
VKTICGQLGYGNWPDYVATWGDVNVIVNEDMAMINNSTYNPKGIKVDAYGMGAYWNGNSIEAMRNNLYDEIVPLLRDADAALDLEGSGIKLVLYEGGQDAVSNMINNARDPEIYQLTVDCYNALSPFIDGPFCISNHVGGYSGNVGWGLKESNSSTLEESHKYRATIDWWNENFAIDHNLPTGRTTQEDTIKAPDILMDTPQIKIHIYPNPAGPSLNLELKDNYFGTVNIKIMNILGAQMMNSVLPKDGVHFLQCLNVDLYPAGIYILVVTEGNKSTSVKFRKL